MVKGIKYLGKKGGIRPQDNLVPGSTTIGDGNNGRYLVCGSRQRNLSGGFKSVCVFFFIRTNRTRLRSHQVPGRLTGEIM